MNTSAISIRVEETIFYKIVLTVCIFMFAIRLAYPSPTDQSLVPIQPANTQTVTIAADASILTAMDQILSRIDTLSESITTTVEKMDQANQIAVSAANQTFVANQAFIAWAIDNGYIEEVKHEQN